MKTHAITTAAVIATLFLLSPIVASAGEDEASMGWFKRTFSKLAWEDLPAVAKTPKDITKRVRAAVEFRSERGDNWASGEETWNRGWGDCEDFAACVVELCRSINVEARVRVFLNRGTRDGHAVAVGMYEGKLWISSNGWYTTVRDMTEAKAVVADEMGWDPANISISTLQAAL